MIQIQASRSLGDIRQGRSRTSRNKWAGGVQRDQTVVVYSRCVC